MRADIILYSLKQLLEINFPSEPKISVQVSGLMTCPQETYGWNVIVAKILDIITHLWSTKHTFGL